MWRLPKDGWPEPACKGAVPTHAPLQLRARRLQTHVRSCLLQATALKLHDTKGQLEQALQQARERLEAGLPPTDDADMEWSALVRQQQTLEDLQAQRQQVRAARARSNWVNVRVLLVACVWCGSRVACAEQGAEPASLPACS